MDAIEALATWRKLPPRARARVTDALRKREATLLKAIDGHSQEEETSALAVLDAS